MRQVLRLAGLSFLAALREKEVLFWFIVFPLLLLSILTLVFGELGQEGTMNFNVALVNADQGEFALAVEEVLASLSNPGSPGKEPLFTLDRPSTGEDPEAFIARKREEVRLGRLALLIVIPPGFTSATTTALLRREPPSPLEVYVNESNAASGMAADVVDQVLARLNREILVLSGAYRPQDAVAVKTEWVGDSGAPVAYVDFLLPGIVLMAFFVGGLFSVPGTILFARDMKILRRYWVTPLGVPQYLAGFSLGYGTMCVLQFALLVLVGRLGFGATVTFARPLAILYLLLSAVTFLALGFLVAALARTAQGGMALANILNMPMLFLSSLFFPVAGLPLFLRAILFVNPLSYLGEGLRFAVGTGQLTVHPALTAAVPLGWVALSVGVAARRLKWDVAR